MLNETEPDETMLPASEQLSQVWTRLQCSRCRYSREHPGGVTEGDLDQSCALCRAGLRPVTVFLVGSPLDACR